MFEGWLTIDCEYFKSDVHAKQHAIDKGYKSLEEAFEDEYMWWTDWHDVPVDDWDELPTEAVVGSLIAEMQALVDTIRTTKYMTEVSAPYQSILDEYRKYIKQ